MKQGGKIWVTEMAHWDQKRYEQEKRSFIQHRLSLAPLWGQFTLIFTASWGAAWFCSWFLWHFVAPTHLWAHSLAIRYAIAFLFAYGCFFLAVRLWIEEAKQAPQHQSDASDLSSSIYPGDGEGCFLVIALMIIGFIVGGLFFVSGGAPLLLEAAFEAAFAGVVVTRPILGNLELGNWKLRLFVNTWKRALLSMLILVVMAAWLQSKVPEAGTFAEAMRIVLSR